MYAMTAQVSQASDVAGHDAERSVERAEPVQVSTLPVQTVGNVEGVEAGLLCGWIMSPVEMPLAERVVEVYEGAARVAVGTANEFRQDLLDANLGDGQLAFRLTLDPSQFDGREHALLVRLAATGVELPVAKVKIPAEAWSSVASVDARCARGRIELSDRSSIHTDSCDIDILSDGAIVASGVCVRESRRRYTFSVLLPDYLADDDLHVFECQLRGRTTSREAFLGRIPSVVTPAQILIRNSDSNACAPLSRIASSRYRSLLRQVERHGRGEIGDARLREIREAHDILVEGFDGRRRFPTLVLPAVDEPRVSIIVPVHGKFELTVHCIASLILTAGDVPFEVILVDDLSTDTTSEVESLIDELVLVRNECNLGFLRSCKAGAAAARGEFLLFLNNDTEVTDGWLDSMVELSARFLDVGAVGSKLVYPDGRLQEAGGIVWGTGEPWNVGHGGNPESPEFNYARQVDYLSGASLLVRRAAWDAVDGFSDELAPAYYEDTDIAFKLREAGFRTFYCPASVVVHFEGMSNGRDLDKGIKRFQAVNAPRFRSRWRHAFRHNGRPSIQNLPQEMDREIYFRALVIDYSTPRPDQDAGGYAVVQEISLLQELGCKVTFLPNNMANLGRYTTALQSRGVECVHAPFSTSPGEYLQKHGRRFDLVYVVRYDVAEQVFPSIREFTDAKIVFNNCDLHFLREARAALSGEGNSLGDAALTRDRELAVMREADAILSYNDLEHSIILSHNFEADKIFKCPWVLSDRRSATPFVDRAGIAFLGSFNHAPNRQAVEFFVREVMPLLRSAGEPIRLHVYGSNVTPHIEALGCDDVIIEGYIDELSTLFDRHRVLVAPLLAGAGIKGKVLESIAHGMPSVLTPVAAESTALQHGRNAFIVESPDEWRDAVRRLHSDETLWRSMSEALLDLVENEFGQVHGLERMEAVMRHIGLEPAMQRRSLFCRDHGVGS